MVTLSVAYAWGLMISCLVLNEDVPEDGDGIEKDLENESLAEPKPVFNSDLDRTCVKGEYEEIDDGLPFETRKEREEK